MPLSPWRETWELGPWSLTFDLAGVVASRLPAWSEKQGGGCPPSEWTPEVHREAPK